MALLEKLGVVRELTGRRRNRLFAYDRYLQISRVTAVADHGAWARIAQGAKNAK